MSNRLISQVVSDFGLLGAIIADKTLNKLNRILTYDSSDASRVKVVGSNYIPLFFNSKWWIIDTDTYIDLDSDLDTGTKAAGKDYYVYACDNSGALDFLISLNSSYPSGYSASTSIKIGGFHTLCVNVGTISGHALTGLTASSVLPDSVWDLKHRPTCSPEGMVYCSNVHLWVDIYLSSGNLTTTASVYNASITNSIAWVLAAKSMSTVNKKLLTDSNFLVIAENSNNETNVTGSTQKITTGGWSDTAGRRMISDIGCEDCCGLFYQHLATPGMKLDDGTATSWYNITKIVTTGSIFTYGTNSLGNIQCSAGGLFNIGTYAGNACRAMSWMRDQQNTYNAMRGSCAPL